MLPLIPIALSLVPEIARWLGGDKAEDTAHAVVNVVRTVTGTDDPQSAMDRLQGDPAAAAQVRVELARIIAEQEAAARAAETDRLKAILLDVQDARHSHAALTTAGSSTAWVGPTLALVIMAGFFGVLYGVIWLGKGADTQGVDLILGALVAMAGAVVNYYFGSSSGSAAKMGTIELAQKALAQSVPAERHGH